MFYPQYSLSAQFRLYDASTAGKYVKGARGVVRRTITEIDETVGLPQIGRGITTGTQRQLRRLLESDSVGGDPIGNVVPSVHLLNQRIISMV